MTVMSIVSYKSQQESNILISFRDVTLEKARLCPHIFIMQRLANHLLGLVQQLASANRQMRVIFSQKLWARQQMSVFTKISNHLH